MAEWYYGKEGQQFGPVDEATLRARVTTSEIRPDDLIWTEGMSEWTPLKRVAQFNTQQVPSALQTAVPVKEFLSDNPDSPYAPPAGNPVVQNSIIGGVQMGPPTSGLAIASMVCGILSLFLCFCLGGIIGLPAVICGHMAMRQTGPQIPGHPLQMAGRGMAIAGLIMGYLGLVTFVILILSNVGEFAG